MDKNGLYSNVPEPEKKPKKLRKKRKRHFILQSIGFLLKLICTVILVALTTGVLLACFGVVYIKTVIMPQTYLDLADFSIQENSVMYYQTPSGDWEELVTLASVANSIPKEYSELPWEMIVATVAIEDKRFWEHPGVDWRRTMAAVTYMFTGADIQGGSTITQQLIKNTTEFDDVTVKRKIIEIFSAFELDSNYSKEDIITRYLNIIYLGEGCYGVGSASWKYFGKDVMDLSLAECASLISITNNPSYYSPYNTFITTDFPYEGYGEMNGRDRNKYRQELVLQQLLEQGTINVVEYAAAVAEPLNFVRGEDEEAPADIYSWYEEQVITDVRNDLIAEFGYSTEAVNMLLSTGGLSIYTLLDPEIQATAESVYQNWDNLPWTSATGQPLQSAITIIDNNTGDVVAIVGQMGDKEQNLLKNFATTTLRQPGSSIKPLSTYAPALDMGLISPVAILDDYAYSLEGGSAWPQNAYLSYRGMITLEYALLQSSNCAAVGIVGNLLTPEVSFQYMTDVLHFDLVDAMESYGLIMTDRAVAPLALGGLTQGVNTRDMAEAYATFPSDGVYTHSRTYSHVYNSAGELILDNTSKQEVAMKETTAYYMNDLLTQVVAGAGTGSAARITGQTVAGKTGTTNDNYDMWFCGYTDYYTAAVWTGYEYNEKITYGTPAMNMWKYVMEDLHNDLPNQAFSVPEGLISFSYCLDSGLVPTSYCRSDPRGSRIASKMIYSGDAPTEYCTAHTAASTVTICVDSAIYNEDGSLSSYALAGSYCPAASQRTSTYLNLNRTVIGNARAADAVYQYTSQGGRGVCQYHSAGWTSTPDEGYLDPENPFGDLFPSVTVPDTTPSTPEPTPVPDSSTVPGVATPSTPTVPTTPEPEPAPVEPTPSEPTTPPVEVAPTTPTVPDVPVVDDSMGIPGVG